MTKDQGGFRAQRADFQARKFQLAHGLPVRIAFAVSAENAVVASSDPVATRESQLRRIPVAFEESGNISTVPGSLLGSQNCTDGLKRAIVVSCCIYYIYLVFGSSLTDTSRYGQKPHRYQHRHSA